MLHLMGIITPARETTYKNCLFTSEKRSTLKEMNLLPSGANFVSGKTHFRRGMVYRKANRKLQKLCPL